MSDITSPVSGPHSAPHDQHDMHVGSPFALRATLLLVAVVAIVLAYVVFHEKSELSNTRTQLTQATADATQARAEADKNKTDATGLQTKLSAATAHATDLQQQLATAQGQGTDFQAQLAKSHAAQTDMRSQLDTAKAQAAGLQSELTRSNDSMADVRKQLDQANARATDLQAQIDKAKSDAASPPAAVAALRTLPISAMFEKGFFGGKYTLHVTNQGSGALPINVTVNGGPVKSSTLQAGATSDFKDLPSGASVVVSSDGFQTSNLTAK
jgi:septal ring factor EnvC (AmiA/AmiB activator)